MSLEVIKQNLGFLNENLLIEIEKASNIVSIEKNKELVREGQFIKVIPIVIEGLIKVFSRYEDKELLLYYIKPSESCIMSFSAIQKNAPSEIFAVTEEDTKVLLLPANLIPNWLKNYPTLNQLFYKQYNVRYTELLKTINHLLFDKLDVRVYNYLVEKKTFTQKNPLKISHRQIANELGTAREVISRIIKKLESENKVKQHSNAIELIK
ncbi:CRP/FNR family transcriptional regulator, anaerobic regulatory protein [Lutibacter oricola]|uniref:CRP/FNR family transcriptional regulator, anaerobic regulatory protein n=1 Tax=Lutibacter oricola TaxID=762486 RepID=A0A1H3F5F0_9FLAO|nr:Crp/Fnr family transcriptional regulator [Lutibacter oricola]SDX85568.1 CRP/FNR family transcriptional regulator, anaerobic regulatory protein [Lutibacter oricola]